jgi:predicted 3-demethylubiquinone-9 3-methyltransferase (glyoxalase superfamily)
MMDQIPTVGPCLWFDGQALEAAEFYVSLFSDSRIERILRSSIDTPGAKKGDPLLVEFTLAGKQHQAVNGGPHDPFNKAISLSILCQDQAEVDRLWDALTADGGQPLQCSWLRDKFGVAWQVVPEALPRMLHDEDPVRAKRVMEAMVQMVKIDVARLQAAYNGTATS